MGIFTSDDAGYKRIGGKTYELRKTSMRKKKLKEKGEDLKDSWLSSVSSYRIKRKGSKWGLYVR